MRASKKVAISAVLGALLFVAQVALSFIPNIEVVSVIIAAMAVAYGLWSLPAVYVFVLLEGVFYGFHIWWVCYLYVWTVLFFAAYFLRKRESLAVWAMLLTIFGLTFGALCSIPYLFVGGVSYAVSWWIAGIPFDALHGAGNLVTGLVLFKPLVKLMKKI